ncbi:MAG: hypothetical protein WCI79_02570 [Candidatus Saccharibacteria bacterium]
MAKTLDEKQQFIELRAKGYSFDKIAGELNISKPTLIDWSRDDDVSNDILNLKALVIDELQEKYLMTKSHRIATFGEILARAKDELGKRDLSLLPTDRLISLTIKLSDVLRQDETEIELIGEEGYLSGLSAQKKWKV